MVKSSFLIKCDFTNGSSNLHPFISMDAQFGHSPPQECGGTTSFVPLNAPSHGSTNNMVDTTADDKTTLVNDLSSSNEEDMVDNLSSSNEEEMVTA